MDPMFEQIHPMFIRSLVRSIEVEPPPDMEQDDQDIYTALGRLLVLLVDETTDDRLSALWQLAVSEQAAHSRKTKEN